MVGAHRFLLVAVATSFTHTADAQHADFAPKVQLILDYLKESGEACMSPTIPGVRSFKACREGAEPVALIIETDVPVRDDDGRLINTCPARLTATPVPRSSAMKMEVSARECPQDTRMAGEFPRTFVGIILQLVEWVRKKGSPI